MKPNALIRQALESRLSDLDPTFETAWENVDFAPTDNPFQAPTHLFAEPDDRGFRDSPYKQLGIFTITLAYPTNQGAADADVKADDIRDWFSRGSSINTENNEFSIVIDRTPEVTGGEVQESRYIVRVRVRWYAYIDGGAI